MRTQQHQRPDRVGPAQLEAGPARLRQGFRQHQQAVEPVEQAQGPRDPERQARIDLAEQAAQGRTQDEAEAEGRADHAEGPCPLFRRGDVGDVGVGGGIAGRGDPRHDAADEQPGQARGQGHHQIVHRQAEVGSQDDRPPPEPVRQGAQQRRADELNHREHGGEHPEPGRRAGGVAAQEALHQPRPDGADHPHRQDIQGHGHIDERRRRRPAPRGDVTHAHAPSRRPTGSATTRRGGAGKAGRGRCGGRRAPGARCPSHGARR